MCRVNGFEVGAFEGVVHKQRFGVTRKAGGARLVKGLDASSVTVV